MINFKNKKILVTGATGGIGREIVKKFISLEGNVLATGTNLEKLDLLKKDFPNTSHIQKLTAAKRIRWPGWPLCQLAQCQFAPFMGGTGSPRAESGRQRRPAGCPRVGGGAAP